MAAAANERIGSFEYEMHAVALLSASLLPRVTGCVRPCGNHNFTMNKVSAQHSPSPVASPVSPPMCTYRASHSTRPVCR